MRSYVLFALATAACAPRWLEPTYQPTALSEARATAAHTLECPPERVIERCDATFVDKPLFDDGGEFPVYDDDGVVGTYVDSAPVWRFDLDVCGQTRRFVRWPRDYQTGYVEDKVACDAGAVCTDRASGCRNVMRGPLWAVLADAPTGCERPWPASDLAVRVDGELVGISVGKPRDELVLAIDGRWYALRGDRAAAAHGDLATGVVLGIGRHSLALIHPGSACEGSPVVEATVRAPEPITWVDI